LNGKKYEIPIGKEETMPSFKDANDFFAKLGVDPAKVPLSKKAFQEAQEKAKKIAIDNILKKK
jgi:hypothetical protein